MRALFTYIIFFYTILTIQAQQKVSTESILNDIKEGNTIAISNATILGVLDLTYKKDALPKLSKKKKWWNFGNSNTIEKQIGSKITFINCIFKNDVLAYIHDESNDYTFIANFKEAIIFKGCTFEESVMFKYSTFKKDSDFTGCKFKNETTFKYAVFEKEISFKNTLFEKSATFKYSKFEEFISFYNASFEESASFKYSKIKNGVSFENTQFKEDLNIKYTEVKGKFMIKNMNVTGKIDSKYTSINGNSFNEYQKKID